MYSKIVWCYVLILTLLDISLNTQLTAQGKSQGASVHDSLVDGVPSQEWGEESAEGAGGAEGAAVLLSPGGLRFGARALAVAHAATVRITNVASSTLHLASVSGSTADFHASFFHSKTLAPGGNTTFSVVYLGRREGPASADLYINTSHGVHKLAVSAVGVASEWEVWPALGVRVPHNATLEPLLTLRNPTKHTIQVREVYSSGAWLGLALPDGAEGAPAALWSVPPRATRPLVRLRVSQPTPPQPPLHERHQQQQRKTDDSLTAYIRIKVNASAVGGAAGAGAGGGGLVLAVEARPAPAGEHARPLQLRLRKRGHLDPPHTLDIEVGNSAGVGARVEGSVWGARCEPAPPAAAPPAPWDEAQHANTNGGSCSSSAAGGASVALLRPLLEPHQPPLPAATLTLDYAKLWAGYSAAGGAGEPAAAAGAFCSGWARVGGAAVPYSVHLVPGTLRLDPPHVDFVTGAGDGAAERELRAHNLFAAPLRITHIEYGPHVNEHFHVSGLLTSTLDAGARGAVLRVRVRTASLALEPALSLATALTLHTNVSSYAVPLRVYSGRLLLEWEWPNSADGALRVGVVGTSQTRRVGARLRNPAPVALCARELRAELPGAHLALLACAPHAPPDHACRCVEAGGWSAAELTVVAPAREGRLAGAVAVSTGAAARALHNVSLRAAAGRVLALPLQLPDAAPYAPAQADLLVDSTMQLPMRVLSVTQPGPPHRHDPAVTFVGPDGGERGGVVEPGRRGVGAVRYAPERACAPACYTGLDPASPEGAAWAARTEALARAPDEGALRADAALARERAARFAAAAAGGARNVSLLVHTELAVQLPAGGAVRLRWPRVAAGGGAAGWAGLAGVGGAATLRVAARNPSRSHALLLHAALGPATNLPPHATVDSTYCHSENCVYSADAFTLNEWRATRGAASEAASEAGEAGAARAGALPPLLLAPGAEVELRLTFAPAEPLALTAYLHLRNNLTIVEAVQLAGRGAFPSFELGGRRPGSAHPLLIEVSECEGGGEGGAVVRSVAVRNTGRVAVRLRDWRVAGAPCAARALRVQPCAPLALPPNRSLPISVAFAPDWTLARTHATLRLRTDLGPAEFQLLAAAPAALLPRCSARLPPPPFDATLRAAGSLLAFALLALVLAAAALDAERLLRRARAARPPAAPPARSAPLDLRALAAAPPAPPPLPAPAPPAPRVPLARRRRTRKLDQHAESRAFELWRASLRRADDGERSSEDADIETEADDSTPPPPPPPAAPAPLLAADAYEPHAPPARAHSSGDDDGSSIGSDSSTSSLSSLPPDHDTDERLVAPRARRAAGPLRAPPSRPERASPAPDAAPHAVARADTPPPAGDAPPRGVRARREREPGDHARRAERRAPAPPADGEAPPRARAALAKPHARKDKTSKRRERAPPTPPRNSPPAHAEARAPAGPAGAAGGVRAGATWSSVVARSGAGGGSPAPAPPAPAGPAARRRAEPCVPPSQDNSLFYFNGDTPAPPPPAPAAVGSRPAHDEFGWRPPPPPDRPVYAPPARDYLEEGAGAAAGAATRAPVWGESLAARAPGAAWPWAQYAAPAPAPAAPASPVRPPPGFGAARAAPPAAAAAPRAVRAFDPFHSLASIWSRTALDWRHHHDTDDDAPDN